MALSTPHELITTLRAEVARYRRLIEHAEGYIAELQGKGPSESPTAKQPTPTPTPVRRNPSAVPAKRRATSPTSKNSHSMIMPGSHAALCKEALQSLGSPQHVDKLFEYCRDQGAQVAQASYLNSTLYRHKSTFDYKGGGVWALKNAGSSTSEQLSLNGNNGHAQ